MSTPKTTEVQVTTSMARRNADKKCIKHTAFVQFHDSTPHRDLVKPEMLMPQRLHFTYCLAGLTYLVFAIQLAEPDHSGLPVQAVGAPGRTGEMLPSPTGQLRLMGTVYNQIQAEVKKPLCSHSQDEL